MLKNPATKYRPAPAVDLRDRQWPARTLSAPPIWCSVDLRDGNQALAVPMNVAQKLELFQTLVNCGFKEIEVGFPSASNTEFAFNRRLIEENRIPEDVTIQVLVQAREDLIERTIESLMGAKRVIIHLYNSTSPAQRRVVFGKSREEIKAIAIQGARWVQERLHRLKGTDVRLQYSPESFSATELEFALEISEAVMAVWQPTPERKMILNLPCTVEVATPNVYAGADRVEGTLFGNGERTGNLDVVAVALNLYMLGIHPNLDLSTLGQIREVYERCTGLTVPPRQPYAGELVFTAFSGSHQDAIKKGLAELEGGTRSHWDVPYLTLDPADIGREYREVIRVNSQSGKGGVAYLLETEFGIELHKDMQREFCPIANDQVDALGREVKAMFWVEYVQRTEPWSLIHFHADGVDGLFECRASMKRGGQEVSMRGRGNGPIAAFVHALAEAGVPRFEVTQFKQHSLSEGEAASAIAYIQIRSAEGMTRWGAGVNTNIELASIQAVISALNRLQ